MLNLFIEEDSDSDQEEAEENEKKNSVSLQTMFICCEIYSLISHLGFDYSLFNW